MDRFRTLEVYVRVVELGSFTKAADSLRLPKATVTLAVRQLEEQLGVRLLQRTTRRLHLTDDGAAYLDGARRLLADWADLDGAVSNARRSPKGRVRVDVPAFAGRHVLAPALPEFLQQYPDIQVELGSSDRPVDLILEGVDCVIRGGTVFDDTLVARPLGRFEVFTVAAPAYLSAHGVPATPEELDGESGHWALPFFSSKTGRLFPLSFARGEQSLDWLGRHRAAANDADTHIALCVAGLGIAQLPRTRRLQELMHTGQLTRLLPDWQAEPLPLNLLYPRNRHLSGRVRAFADWVVGVYGRKFAELGGAG